METGLDSCLNILLIISISLIPTTPRWDASPSRLSPNKESYFERVKKKLTIIILSNENVDWPTKFWVDLLQEKVVCYPPSYSKQLMNFLSECDHCNHNNKLTFAVGSPCLFLLPSCCSAEGNGPNCRPCIPGECCER